MSGKPARENIRQHQALLAYSTMPTSFEQLEILTAKYKQSLLLRNKEKRMNSVLPSGFVILRLKAEEYN